MKNLLLTLGHNSSAILIEDGEIKWGYETERLTGLKSDSHFPEAVMDLKRFYNPDMIYITHWAPSGVLSDMAIKYWKPAWCDGIPIRTHSPDRSHHDTHIYSATAYAGDAFTNLPDTYGLVIDGFGTMGEHLSIYRFNHGVPVLKRRVHGYETSLGLWYQYATAFMGMKMHEDEYKLLGYEVHCPTWLEEQVQELANIRATEMLENMSKSVYGSQYDPVYDLAALANIRENIFQHLSSVCKLLDIDDPATTESRAVLSRYVQSVLERVVLSIVCDLGAQNLVCGGGCFLNVKLNKCIIDALPGQLCVNPLAGDQGNALGLYHLDHPEFKIPNDLCWGRRELPNLGSVDGLFFIEEARAQEHVIRALELRGYVNLVRGHMEFGPRALCNTTTLAMPTSAVVNKINVANDRNTVMPMAPVMTRAMYQDLFVDTHKVWKSEQHMIVAMQYRHEPGEGMLGIAHPYTLPTPHWTGRPQVTEDPFMVGILEYFGHPLINTSFNFHGQPIAFDTPQVIMNHRMQHARDASFNTIIVPNQS